MSDNAQFSEDRARAEIGRLCEALSTAQNESVRIARENGILLAKATKYNELLAEVSLLRVADREAAGRIAELESRNAFLEQFAPEQPRPMLHQRPIEYLRGVLRATERDVGESSESAAIIRQAIGRAEGKASRQTAKRHRHRPAKRKSPRRESIPTYML